MQDHDKIPTETLSVLRPRMDAYEKDGATELVVEMPGVSRDALEVILEDDLLTVRGRLELREGHEGLTLGREEFGPGVWERSFRLGEELDTGRIEASLEDGLLRITLPHRQPERRSITVRGPGRALDA